MNKENTRRPAAEIALILVAALLRFLFLEWKSPHFDEGINGHFVIQIWDQGFFQYDPTNFHGPLYFYYLHFAEALLGRGIFAFRAATALLSVGVVYMTVRHARYVGKAAYWAAALIAVSPAFVFYGRYAIHETLLILSQLLFSYGFLQWREGGGKSAVLYMVGGTLVALATKETFFIFTGTWLIAWGLLKFSQRVLPRALRATDKIPEAKDVGGKEQWLTVSFIGATLIVLLFSAVFMDQEGLKNLFRAFAFWTKTGTGATGHEKSFFYWIRLMWQYEWPLLFALIFGPIFALYGSVWMRVMTAAGFGLWLAYSLIPYKTPWCLIGFWPLAFAFGFMMTETKARFRLKYAHVVGAALIAVSAFTSLRLNFREYHNGAEPYVYVQSRPDLNFVTSLLEARAKIAPEERAMTIQVALQDTWPLPWLLSRYPGTAFNNSKPSQALPNASVILADGDRAIELEPTLKQRYIKQPFQIRDAYGAGFAYFSADQFRLFFNETVQIVGPEKKIEKPSDETSAKEGKAK